MNNQVTIRENEIKSGLVAQQKIVKSLLGSKEKSDKFLATAVKIANDYKLRECHPQSIIDACINVAQLGLDLSPIISHAYLVPFKAKRESKVANVQLIISARGYTALLERTGWKIKSYIVNEDDDFEYSIDGFEETIKFKKDLDGTDENFKYAVAIAKAPDDTVYVEVMNKSQIEKHRKVSQNQKGDKPSGVWEEWYDRMALKTVIKKLVKKLPLGEETISRATFIDDKPIEAQIENETQNELPSMNEIVEEKDKYQRLISMGVKENDLQVFMDKNNLDDNNLDIFLEDYAGAKESINKFYEVKI